MQPLAIRGAVCVIDDLLAHTLRSAAQQALSDQPWCWARCALLFADFDSVGSCTHGQTLYINELRSLTLPPFDVAEELQQPTCALSS